MHLVEEDDRRRAAEGGLAARLGDDVAQGGDPVHRRVERLEAGADRLGEEPPDRRLARSRRPPEEHRRQAAALHEPAQRSARGPAGAPGRRRRRAWPAACARRGASARPGARRADRGPGRPGVARAPGHGTRRVAAAAAGDRRRPTARGRRSRSPRGPRGRSTASGPAVEGRDPAHAQPLGGGDEQGVGEPRPVLCGGRRRAAARSRSASVGATTRTAPEVHGRDEGQRWPARPSSRWSTWSASASVSAPTSSGSSDAGEPGPGRRVVEVGRVGRGEDRRRVEQDRHRPPLPAVAAAPARPSSRPAIRRASSESRPWALRPIPTNGQLRRRRVRLEVRLQRRRDDGRLRRRGPAGRGDPPGRGGRGRRGSSCA